VLVGAAWSSQAQAIEFEDALQVRKQHLDLLAITPGLLVGGCLGDRTGDIASGFVNVSRDLPTR
jgi:hypothetical protein